MSSASLLGPDGRELPPSRRPAGSRMALNGTSWTPHDAADVSGQHMAAWQPQMWSPDGEVNMYRDRIVSRVQDLVRNDGWASGGVTRILDAAIGGSFRPIAKPDYRALAAYTGNTAFDVVWATEYARAAGVAWRTWSDGPGHYCDAARKMTGSQIMRVNFRHKLVDGDALALPLYLPDRLGPGRSHFATTIQTINPDRLSNPQQRFDTLTVRGGVEIDGYGAATAYHIRKGYLTDYFSAGQSVTWERITREDAYGRPRVVHDFDVDRGGTNRGGAGILGPVVQRLKMLIKYDGTELDAAIINAIFGAYVTSPFDREMVGEALGENASDDESGLGRYQDMRSAFHRERPAVLGSSRIPVLFPGESINTVAANRPATNFAAFEGAVLRNVASAMGLSYEQLTQDYSQSNYSSSRAATVELWKTMSRRRHDFGSGFASPIFGCVLEEAHDKGDLPLPTGAPPFYEYRGPYGRCHWIGPGRGWVDPVAERQGSVMAMEAGLSTLEIEAAENVGADWEELLDQRQIESEAFKLRGLVMPVWGTPEPGKDAGDKPSPPKKPETSSSGG